MYPRNWESTCARLDAMLDVVLFRSGAGCGGSPPASCFTTLRVTGTTVYSRPGQPQAAPGMEFSVWKRARSTSGMLCMQVPKPRFSPESVRCETTTASE